jgi:hypothetical protein
MTVTVLGMDGNPFDQASIQAYGARFLAAYVKLVLSGNYATGGDLLDLTNGGGTPAAPTVIPQASSRGLAQLDLRPMSKLTSSFTAASGQYIVLYPSGIMPIPFSALNALRLKLMLDVAVEYSAGAYGADALGDILIAELIWVR